HVLPAEGAAQRPQGRRAEDIEPCRRRRAQPRHRLTSPRLSARARVPITQIGGATIIEGPRSWTREFLCADAAGASIEFRDRVELLGDDPRRGELPCGDEEP